MLTPLIRPSPPILIEDLELTARPRNSLQAMGIAYVSQLIAKNENDLGRIEGLGIKSLNEIKQELDRHGLRLGTQSAARPSPPILIEDLELKARPRNSLQAMGIAYVSQLIAKSENDLGRIEGLGIKSLNEIKQELGRHGLSLGTKSAARPSPPILIEDLELTARPRNSLQATGIKSDPVNALYPLHTCTWCGETKPTTRANFGTKANGKPRHWCRECTRKRTNEYSAANRELGRARARNRKEQLEAVGVVNEHLQFRESLFKQQNEKCYFCKNQLSLEAMEIDHLTPISRGGGNDYKNLAACCLPCNRAKTNRTEEEFIEWRKKRLINYR